MNYQNEQKTIQKQVPELCIKCKQMFGHETFSKMCSKCFKTQKLQTQLLEKKELPLIEVKQTLKMDQQQKKQKKIEKEQITLGRRDTDRTGQDKVERERTRQKEDKKIQNKCFSCNKKTGMLGYECKHCVNSFCKFHRLPEDHSCQVDFISAGKKLLTQANPQIKTRKISGMDH